MMTMDPTIEIIMGIACCFAYYLGHKHNHTRLKQSSAFDAIWTFAWGFGLFGEFF